MKLEEMKKRLGCLRAPEDRRDFVFRAPRRLFLPESMDTRLSVIIGKRQWCLCFRPQESSICVHKTDDE